MDGPDQSFGPRLFGHFDFTLLFEHSIFEILPSAVILFVVPFYVYTIVTSTARVRFGFLLWCKLAACCALLGVQVGNAALWWASPLQSGLANAAAVMSCATAACIGIIVYAGHVYFLHSSAFLSLFLTVTMLLDAAATRSYFQRHGLEVIARLHLSIPILKFVLVAMEEIPKRSLIKKEELRASATPETLAGFWNRSLFFWVNSTLLIGFRSTITQDKLGDIGAQFDSETLYKGFERNWDDSDKNKSKFSLLMACFKTVPWLFIYIIPPRLLNVGLQYAQPFLLQEVVKVVGIPDPDPATTSGLIGATAFIFFGKSIVRGWYNHFKNQIMTSIRGMLIAAIYHKMLLLGEKDAGKLKALTLMGTDVVGIERLITLSYESWARLLELGAGIAILNRFIGPSCFLVLIPAVLATICSTRLANRMKRTRKDWNEHIETRVAATSNVLAQMKDVKMMGLAPAMAEHLQEMHDAEIKVSLRDRTSLSCVFALSALVETVTPAVVIAASIFSPKGELTVDKFFTVLAVVTMITIPLAAMLSSISFWAAGFASLSRIQEYLLQEEPKEVRVFENEPDAAVPQAEATGMTYRGSAGARSRKTTQGPRFAIRASDVSVAFDPEEPILRDITVNIAKGSKTMVLGTVGSGKSTLLKALLGEVKPQRGEIKLASKKAVAYCSQVPWIINDTIQSNVVGSRMYNAVLLRMVIWATALDIDIAELPDGILTICGSDGRNLSGGQKQRVALARSLYSEAEAYLLDDVFSSLDGETSDIVRERLFGDDGVLQSKTVVMVSSISEHMEDADVVFELQNGRIREVAKERISNMPSRRRLSGTPSKEDEKSETPAVVSSDDQAEPIPNRKNGDWSLYSCYLGPAGWKALMIWLSTVVIAAVGEKMPQIFARLWLDRAPGSRIYYIGFAILSIANPTLNMLATSTFYYLVYPSASRALHWRLADTTSRATFDFLAKEDAGSLLNRFGQDTSLVNQRLPLAILPASWLGVTVLMDVAIIAAGATFAAPILPFFLIVVAVVQHFYLQTSRQLRVIELDTSKKLYKHFGETAAGIAHIRAFQRQSDFIAQFYVALDETQKPFYLLFCVQQWLTLALDMGTAVAAVAVVSLAVKFTAQTSNTAMGLALLSLITCSEVAITFVQMWVETETCLGAVARIRDFGNKTPVEKDCEVPVELPRNWPEYGKVDFQAVYATYQTSVTSAHTVLHNATVSVKPGQTVAITGRTGSGKTSLLLSLLNLIEYSGGILVDNVEIGRVPRRLLRARITTITQSAVQLRGSIRYNLDPFGGADLRAPDRPVTDELLVDTLRQVGLWGIVEERGGLDADMGKMELSQGQKQLLQLARAIVHQHAFGSRVVLVDEGSSSVDEDTEARMQRVMGEVFAGCTLLMISHRPAALRMADYVLRLVDGQLRVDRREGEAVEGLG